MMYFICFALIITTVIFFPYRKVYHLLKRYANVKTLLTGVFLIAFPFIWQGFRSEALDALIQVPADADRYRTVSDSLVSALSWLFILAGVITAVFAVLQARESAKAEKKA